MNFCSVFLASLATLLDKLLEIAKYKLPPSLFSNTFVCENPVSTRVLLQLIGINKANLFYLNRMNGKSQSIGESKSLPVNACELNCQMHPV